MLSITYPMLAFVCCCAIQETIQERWLSGDARAGDDFTVTDKHGIKPTASTSHAGEIELVQARRVTKVASQLK